MIPAIHTDIIRPFVPLDKQHCLALFDSNVPVFFSEMERAGFSRFLDVEAEKWSYQVIEKDSMIAACGGFAVGRDGETAYLCWGMVAKELHGSGLGNSLTKARIIAAKAQSGITQVRIDTSQKTQGFYRRFGFVPENIVADGYAPGLDRWDMILRF